MHCAWPGDCHSLGLSCFQFHSPKVTPLTNIAKVMDQGLCYCISNGWDGTTAIKVDLCYIMGKSIEVYRRNNNRPKTLPCSTPETSSSLLRLPSTITCGDQLDRNCVTIDSAEPPTPTEQSLKRMPWWFTLSKSTQINLHDPSLLPTLQCTLQCMGHARKCITGTPTSPIRKMGGWKHTIAFHKTSNMFRHQALKHLRQ